MAENRNLRRDKEVPDKHRPYQAVPDLITIFAGVNSKAWEEQGSFAGDSAQVEQEQPAEGRSGITSSLPLPSSEP